jgi:N-acetylglucosamine-6-phosphate deacetylase
MTIAPELPGALEVMRMAAHDGVILSIGHSEAQYEDIETAIDNGLSQVTHIFNAMHPLHHRNPGVLTGALLKRELKVQLIGDGVHVHPAVTRLLYQLKGAEGILLVTDAISATGRPDGKYALAGREITCRNGQAYLRDGTLAGSTVTMERAVGTLVRNVGIPVAEAVRMASLNPARVLGLDHRKGVLAVGKDADCVILNDDYTVDMTIIGGEVVYRKNGA